MPEEQEKKQNSRPARWRLMFVSAVSAFLALGTGASIFGPTLLDMEAYLSTNMKGMALSLTLHSTGYALGCILCGFVFDRFHPELQMSLASLGNAVTTAMAPWSRHLAGYCAFLTVKGSCGGFIDSSGQTYLLSAMSGSPHAHSAIQAMHTVWDVGASVGPLIAQNFLLPRKQASLNITAGSYNQTSVIMSNSAAYSLQNSTINAYSFIEHEKLNTTDNTFRAMKVPFAYLTVGTVCVMLSLPFCYTYLSGPKYCTRRRAKKSKTDSSANDGKSKPTKFTVIIMCISFWWTFLQEWSKGVISSFIAAWVVRELNWTKFHGSLLVSVYWGFHCFGHLLSIAIAAVLTPRQMLCISYSLALTSGVSLLLFHHLHPTVVWVCLAAAGLGWSCTFGCLVLTISHHVILSGATAAVLLAGFSVGGMVAPAVTGHLFYEYSPMWLLYVSITGTSLMFLTFLSIELFVHLWKRRHGRTYGNTVELEVTVGLTDTNTNKDCKDI